MDEDYTPPLPKCGTLPTCGRLSERMQEACDHLARLIDEHVQIEDDSRAHEHIRPSELAEYWHAVKSWDPVHIGWKVSDDLKGYARDLHGEERAACVQRLREIERACGDLLKTWRS